jgi:hypothetical protein
MKKLLATISLIWAANLIYAQPYRGEQCIVKSEFIYQPEDVKFPG